MNVLKTVARLPDYAVDIKTSLVELFSSLPTDLSEAQVHGVSLTAAYFLKNEQLLNDIRSEAKLYLNENDANACKIAVIMMALNNTYYCAQECDNSDREVTISINKSSNPGVSSIDFGYYCLAASILHKCKPGIKYHMEELLEQGVNKECIKAVTNIVSILIATAEALNIESVRSYEFIARQPSM